MKNQHPSSHFFLKIFSSRKKNREGGQGAHTEGKKHKGCVREYYSTFEADIVQVPLFFFFFFSPRQFWIHESKSSKLERQQFKLVREDS